ncbi:MAG: RND family efflux transporter MFP subunit, partial [uncultured bacterium]
NSVVDVEIRDLAIRFATITSPIDGYIVSDPSVYAGSNVLATDTIATVASNSKLQFAAEVDETEIGKVRLGQEANITLDAFPDTTFSSTVSQILPQAITTSTGATAFNVTFNVESAEPLLIGMNGSAQIITDTKENVTSVPIEAIIDDNSVWVKKGKSYQKVEVSKGLESESDVEITSGISNGETIITAGFDQLQKASLFQKIIGSVL